MSKFDKRKLTRFYSWLRTIKTWQLVGLLLIGLVLSVSLLRINNLGMIERREAVKAADVVGDESQLRQSLVDLQHYVSSHMNTSMGPNGVALENSYNRAVEAWASENANRTDPDADVYQQASIECRSRFQGGVESFRNDYVRCVAERVASIDNTDIDLSDKPRVDIYQINFASPVWSPDLAGFMVMFCVFITGVIILRVITVVALRLLMKNRLKGV